MLSLVAKHTELKSLTWKMGEFAKLIKDGTIRRPEVWAICLRIAIFGKLFYIPVCKVI